MRWNESEMVALSQKTPADREGKLLYRPPAKYRSTAKAIGKGIVGKVSGALGGGPSGAESSDEARERWFRLRGNLLFYFRLQDNQKQPQFPGSVEPLGVLVLEHYHVQREGFEEGDAFSIIFTDDPSRKHLFVAESPRSAYEWDMALREASCQALRDKLQGLQAKLRDKLEADPLKGSMLEEGNPIFASYTTTSRLITGSNSQLNALHSLSSCCSDDPPKPKPRTKQKNLKKEGSFTLHSKQDWEKKCKPAGKAKSTFQCHLPNEASDDVPVGPLLDL